MRRTLFIVTAVGGALIVAVVMLEVALRLLRLAPTDGVFTVDARQFGALPGILAPAPTIVDRRNRALPHQATIDSLGFRGAEVARTKSPGEIRIVFIGDSFVYGDFVDDDETWPAQLERRLRAQCGDITVVNAGLPGASISEQRPIFTRTLAVSPDLAVLSFTENDVTDLNGEVLWSALARNREVKSSFPMRHVYPIVRTSALWNVLLAAQGRWRGQRNAAAAAAAPAERPEDVPQRQATLRARWANEFTGLRDDARKANVPLVFTSFPSHLTVQGKAPDEQIRWVHEVVQGAGVPDVPTLGALRATGRGERELYLLPHDGHPSVDGYRVVTKVLADYLVTMPPLAGRCASRE